jgi:hypothetical protein
MTTRATPDYRPITEAEDVFAKVGDYVDGRGFVGTTVVYCSKCARVRTHRLWARAWAGSKILTLLAERDPKLYCRFCFNEVRAPVVVALAIARVVNKDTEPFGYLIADLL